MKKRILSVLLVLALCLSLLPTAAFAAEDDIQALADPGDVYEITDRTKNPTITSGGAANTVNLVSGWKSTAVSIGMRAKVQSVEWSISDTSAATLKKAPYTDTESVGISTAILTANPGVTQDETATVTVKITYTYEGSTYTAEDSTQVTIKAQQADADQPQITVSPTEVNLEVGEKTTVTATLTGVKNASDYRMSWQFIYDSPAFSVSGVTKDGSFNGTSHFDSQGNATITVTGKSSGSGTFFPVLQTSGGKPANYDGNDGSNNVDVTVTGSTGDSAGGASSDTYEITDRSKNATITSGGPTNTISLISGWRSTAANVGMRAKVQSIEWSISNTSAVTLAKSPLSDSKMESLGISTAIATANPSVTKDETVTVTVKITYTYNGSTYTAEDSTQLTIKAQQADADKPKITVSPTKVNLGVGEKTTVTATLTGVKNYSDYRMNWQGIYDSACISVSGATKDGVLGGNSNFDSQGRATITVTGRKYGSTTFFPILKTSEGKPVTYEGNDSSNNVDVTVSTPITVSFNSNGGSSVSSKSVFTGQEYGSLPTPTRKDYVFNGWYTSRTGGSEVTSSTKVTATSSHTLYAHWTESKQVKVSFYSSGGTSVPDKFVVVGQNYGSLPMPTRSGYLFDGWYTSSTGGSEVTSITKVTNTYNHTLYARWTQTNGKLTVSPDKISFNSEKEGYSQPAAQTVTIKNTGNASLNLVQPSASSFELGSLSKTSLGANSSATFTVRPKAGLKAGTYNEGITVKSTDGKAAASLSVSFTVEAESAAPSPSFTDVQNPSAYYYKAVQWAVEKGVTSGTSATTFSPENICTRAQVVMFLYRVAGQQDTPSISNPFTDVKESDYYYQSVLWAVEHQITGGTGNGVFSPGAPCTRAQVVTFLWNAAGRPEPQNSASPFTDVQNTNAYYYKAVLWAAEKGITSGTSSTAFSPDATCTRGQIVTFLHRAYQ